MAMMERVEEYALVYGPTGRQSSIMNPSLYINLWRTWTYCTSRDPFLVMGELTGKGKGIQIMTESKSSSKKLLV